MIKVYFFNPIKKIIFLILFLLLANPLFAQKWFDMMNDENVNFYDVQREAESYFAIHGTGRGTGYKIYKRWEYENQFEIDQFGNRKKATEIVEEFNRYKQSRSGKRESAVQAGDNWVDMGPTYWSRTSGWNPGVGRITFVAVDPKNNNIIYIASPGGGAWKTTNGGTSWVPLMDRLPGMVMFSVGIDPVNTNNVYFGSERLGIYKSTNGGSSVSAINSGYPTSSKTNKIIVNPSNTNIVLAASSAGIYRSTNAGGSWVQVASGGFNDIEFKPGDPNTVYACGNKFFKSTNGGSNFSQIDNGIPGSGRSFIAVTPANPNYVYMLQARGNEFGALYRSTDSGNSFVTRVSGNAAAATNYFGYSPAGTDTGGQAFHDMALCVSPSNTEEVHIAGIICWKSTNGGSSFVSTTEWSYPNNRGYNHADVHALEYVGSTIYSGSDGGIFKSTDQAENWTDLSRGLGIRQFYKIACAATDASMVGGGSQDNGHSIIRNGAWIDWLGADGMDVMIDHKNANIIYACTQNGGLNKSTNGGQSRTNVTKPAGDGNWVTPLAMDPVNSNTIYIGLAEIHRSTNGGSSWSQISSLGGSGGFDNITIAPSNGNYIYASKGNTLYVTKNGGTSWTNITAGLSGRITAITVHNSSADKVAVSTSNGSAKVYKSTNAGTNWTNFQKSLPNLSANTLVFQNGNSEGMYVGMDVGIYYIDNTLAEWVPFMTNIPNVKIYELEIHAASGKIRAGTHGRGLWESALYTPTTTNVPPVVSITSPANNATFPASVNLTINASASDQNGSISKVEFFNGTTLLVSDATAPYSYSFSNIASGTYNITAKATDNAGATTTSALVKIVITELPKNPVLVYQNCNNDPGYIIGLNAGTYTTAQLNALGIADNDISSIKVQAGYQVMVYADNNFTGTTLTYTTDQGCLTSSNFNDAISSIKISLINQPPTVALTSPANNSSYGAPATIALAANAADTGGGTITKVEFFSGTTLLGSDATAPYTYNWQNVAAGTYTITAKATDNDNTVTTSSAVTVTVTIPQSPYNGVVAQIPGVIQAENYDLGGQGVAYYDNTPTNLSGAYRTDAVDIEPNNQGGFNVDYVATDEWMEYTVNVTSAGAYNIDAYVATTSAGKSFRMEMNGSVLGNLLPPNTGGWQNWQKVSLSNINLTAGQKIFRIYATSTDLNMDKFEFSKVVIANQPPTVNLTAPVANASFTAPDSISLSANAADADGTLSKVEFFNGSTLIGSDATAPYNFIWKNIAVGNYTINAKATDNAGATTTSAAVTITVNPVSPTGPVIVYQNCNNTPGYAIALNVGTYTTAQLIALGIADNDISRIQVQSGYQVIVYADNNFAGTSQIYTSEQACMTSSNFNDVVSSIRIALLQSPVIALTSPGNNASFSAPASINLAANASDPDGGAITKVEFFQGTSLLGTDVTAPYTYTWTNVAAGQYTLTAKATDNSGATKTTASVTVTVTAPVGDACSSLSAYVENNGYVAGSKVKNAGGQYECKPWPMSGWCNGASWAYAPGTGIYWTDAWTSIGSCNAAAKPGVDNHTASQTLTMMPNPFATSTTIEVYVAEAGEVSVQVFDKTGVLVQNIMQGYLPVGSHAFTFDGSAIPSGLYTIKYNTPNGVSVGKIIKAGE
ncbi:MAG: C-terminal target protein [Cytophagaceae bacterium]|jgi:photosystem II stability/assembly factor-like uncharacterized protein|nr:C-terminal target protein [Cytophagaceae bacterium]